MHLATATDLFSGCSRFELREHRDDLLFGESTLAHRWISLLPGWAEIHSYPRLPFRGSSHQVHSHAEQTERSGSLSVVHAVRDRQLALVVDLVGSISRHL